MGAQDFSKWYVSRGREHYGKIQRWDVAGCEDLGACCKDEQGL